MTIAPPPAAAMMGAAAWMAKKLVAQVDRDPAVPIGLGDAGPRVPLVVRCIVDEGADRAEVGRGVLDRGLQGGGVGHVAAAEPGARAALLGQHGAQGLGAVGGEVDEGDAGALAREGLHHGGADALGAPADEDGPLVQARVDRAASHSTSSVQTWAGSPAPGAAWRLC